ncbi:MAG TPA: hypothetical protein VGO59_19040 [Verrucomicrobiae bacterium]|jgi:hypothetical protein
MAFNSSRASAILPAVSSWSHGRVVTSLRLKDVKLLGGIGTYGVGQRRGENVIGPVANDVGPNRRPIAHCFKRKNWAAAESVLVKVNLPLRITGKLLLSSQIIGGVKLNVDCTTNPVELVGQERTAPVPLCIMESVGGLMASIRVMKMLHDIANALTWLFILEPKPDKELPFHRAM